MQKGPDFLVDIRGLMGKVAEWIENRCMLIRCSVLKYAIGNFELIQFKHTKPFQVRWL